MFVPCTFCHKRTFILIAAGFFLVSSLPPALSCRYSVRDVAFAQLDPYSYRLFILTDAKTAGETSQTLLLAANKAFQDSNVLAETVRADDPKDRFARKYPDKHKITEFPALVLAYDEEHSLLLPSPAKDPRAAFEQALRSPMRDEITRRHLESYATVLIMEGMTGDENRQVRGMADQAVRRVTNQLKILPKEIKNPPVVSVLPRARFDEERILLWCIEEMDVRNQEPAVLVFHGRGRRVGPLLRGKEITEERLYNILATVGQDCECGLDRIWMQGRTIPYRFDKIMREKIARHLGFDPDSPMVKMEMNQILRIAPSSAPKKPKLFDVDTPAALGYREIEIPTDPAAFPRPQTDLPSGAATTPAPTPAREPGPAAPSNAPSRAALWTMLSLAVAVLSIGTGILLWAKGRTPWAGSP